MHRLLRILLAFSVLALPLLACGAPVQYVSTAAAPGASAPAVGSGDLADDPTTYVTANGEVYSGWHAQVLNQLFSLYPGQATTYPDHTKAAGGLSADLWATGAVYGANNSGMQSMDALHAYIMANMDALGIWYTVWEQQITYAGQAPSLMADRGSLTQNHFDHVHITFIDGVLQVLYATPRDVRIVRWEILPLRRTRAA